MQPRGNELLHSIYDIAKIATTCIQKVYKRIKMGTFVYFSIFFVVQLSTETINASFLFSNNYTLFL